MATEITGTIKDLTFDRDGAQLLQLRLDGDFRDKADELLGKRLDIKLAPVTKRRSKSANDYMWTLCEKLAIHQGVTKEEVYRKNIREVGVFEILPIKAEHYEHFKDVWGSRGIGWFVELIGDSKHPGFVKVFAYYGSSTYTVEEMRRLIDSVCEDCRACGIETRTPDELAELLAMWK